MREVSAEQAWTPQSNPQTHVWWCALATPMLGRQRQADLRGSGQPGLLSEHRARRQLLKGRTKADL